MFRRSDVSLTSLSVHTGPPPEVLPKQLWLQSQGLGGGEHEPQRQHLPFPGERLLLWSGLNTKELDVQSGLELFCSVSNVWK